MVGIGFTLNESTKHLSKFAFVSIACFARMFVSFGRAGSNSECKFRHMRRPHRTYEDEVDILM